MENSAKLFPREHAFHIHADPTARGVPERQQLRTQAQQTYLNASDGDRLTTGDDDQSVLYERLLCQCGLPADKLELLRTLLSFNIRPRRGADAEAGMTLGTLVLALQYAQRETHLKADEQHFPKIHN